MFPGACAGFVLFQWFSLHEVFQVLAQERDRLSFIASSERQKVSLASHYPG
jgi:hypothetical protein